MLSEFRTLIAFALIVKFLVISFTVISSFLPDHEAGAFSPPEALPTSRADKILRTILSGFHKWDAIYFHFISVNGYIYENTLAFFPLLPICLSLLSRPTSFLLSLWSLWTHNILIGVLFNTMCHIVGALQFYRLSNLYSLGNSVSLVSALLFLVNPASIFFSSLYSESLYSLLLISAMINIHRKFYFLGNLLLSLSALCRSNGLVNCGFACFPHFVVAMELLLSSRAHLSPVSIFKTCICFLYRVVVVCLTVVCVSMSYVIYQYYGGFLYCPSLHRPPIFSYLIPSKPNSNLSRYANDLGVFTPYTVNVTSQPPWCKGVPWSSYMLLQNHFWNVGAFRYYQWKQIPNFLLATPVLFLVFKVIVLFINHAPKTFLSLGVLQEHPKSRLLLPHIYHAAFMALYGIVNVHVQVLTRMLFSSCPVLYWYCASVLLGEQNRLFGAAKPNKTCQVGPKLSDLFSVVNPLSYSPRSSQRLLLCYFYSYIVVGCVLHSNFLPWT